MDSPTAPRPVVCDMTTATDTVAERMADYRRLFDDALIGREKTDGRIEFRFRADPGVEERVRDLVAREQACCAFVDFTVTRSGEEVLWSASVDDDDAARAILAEFYLLPDTAGLSVETLHERFTAHGLRLVGD